MSDRLPILDVLRGVCVLWIVAFWHLMNYTAGFPGYDNVVTERVTVTVLATFVFLSGFVLGLRPMQPGIGAVVTFYRKRVLRILPLYLLASGVFWVLKVADGASLLKGVLLVSMFYGPPPFTLWFISMIMVFYALAPWLIRVAGEPWRFALLAMAAFGLLLAGATLTGTGDPRVVIYFPAFVAGLFCARQGVRFSGAGLLGTGVATLGALVVSALFAQIPEMSFFSLPMAVAMPVLIFAAAQRWGGGFAGNRGVAALSYAGFVMYLLHRPIYKVLSHFSQHASSPIKLAYLLCVGVPVVFAVSWVVQTGYDRALRRLGA